MSDKGRCGLWKMLTLYIRHTKDKQDKKRETETQRQTKVERMEKRIALFVSEAGVVV